MNKWPDYAIADCSCCKHYPECNNAEFIHRKLVKKDIFHTRSISTSAKEVAYRTIHSVSFWCYFPSKCLIPTSEIVKELYE